MVVVLNRDGHSVDTVVSVDVAAVERAGCQLVESAESVDRGGSRFGRRAITPVDAVAEGFERWTVKMAWIIKSRIGERTEISQAERAAFGNRLIPNGGKHWQDVCNRDFKGLRDNFNSQLVIVLNRDGHSVGTVVSVDVAAIERADGQPVASAGSVDRAISRFGRRAITPIDTVAEGFERWTVRMEWIIKSRIGERTEISQVEQTAFGNRLIANERKRRRDVADRDRKGLGHDISNQLVIIPN